MQEKGLIRRTVLVCCIFGALAMLGVPACLMLVSTLLLSFVPRFSPAQNLATSSGSTAVMALMLAHMISKDMFETRPFHYPMVMIAAIAAGCLVPVGHLASRDWGQTIACGVPWIAFLTGLDRGVHAVTRKLAWRRGVGTVCGHCGYDMKGLANYAKCPECGGVYRYAQTPTPRT